MDRSHGLRRLRAALLAALVAVAAWPARADTGKDVAAPAPKKSFNVQHPLPFKFGEKLVYDVKFSRFPIYALDGCARGCAARWLEERGIRAERSFVIVERAATQ